MSLKVLNIFEKIFNDKDLDCQYRYKCILNLENMKLEEFDYYMKNSLYSFIQTDTNMTMYRILAGQYLLQNFEGDKLGLDMVYGVQQKLLSFAEDEELDYNLRADAADTLMNLAREDRFKDKARDIIIELGRVFGKVRTVFDNAQNVHVDSIEQSILEALEFLSTVPTMCLGNIKDRNYITFNYVYGKIEELLKNEKESIYRECSIKREQEDMNKEDKEENIGKNIHECILCSYCNSCVLENKYKQVKENYFCSNKCIDLKDKADKIRISLNRINMDRILYSKYNQTLVNIFVKIWSYMVEHDSFEDMKSRMLEELYEMSGTCSSGFASRLINVISGFGDFNVKISWDEQIVANFSGRLNATCKKD